MLVKTINLLIFIRFFSQELVSFLWNPGPSELNFAAINSKLYSFEAKSVLVGICLSTWSKSKETTCPAGQINPDKPKSVIRHVRTTDAAGPAQMQGMSTAIHQPELSCEGCKAGSKMELLSMDLLKVDISNILHPKELLKVDISIILHH